MPRKNWCYNIELSKHWIASFEKQRDHYPGQNPMTGEIRYSLEKNCLLVVLPQSSHFSVLIVIDIVPPVPKPPFSTEALCSKHVEV